jgi:hypothetical protein
MTPAGLCATCQHKKEIRSDRGSVFILCQLGLTRPEEFPKYPRLPVVKCAGYSEKSLEGSGRG